MTAPAPLRELGITVLPEYIQSDGIEGVLRNIRDIARATSVTTSPYVVTEAAPGTGEREPPIDGGAGKDRLLDRPLWGKRDVWMTASCSYTPDAARYAGLAYRPPATDAATARDGHLVGEFLTAAKARGMETWIQVQAAIPPGHRVQFGRPNPGDRSLLPDGTAFDARVDRNASLAAPDLRAYMRAFVADLCAAYPQADGFKFDWPEYPAYHFEALFFDFNPAAAPYAARAGAWANYSPRWARRKSAAGRSRWIMRIPSATACSPPGRCWRIWRPSRWRSWRITPGSCAIRWPNPVAGASASSCNASRHR